MFFLYASYKSFTRNSWWSKKNEDIFSILWSRFPRRLLCFVYYMYRYGRTRVPTSRLGAVLLYGGCT
eukprot:SAG11_NODE_3882_length_2170_cov_3.027040_2_plen_67_part_00